VSTKPRGGSHRAKRVQVSLWQTLSVDARIEAWMARGDFLDLDGRRIFWWEQGTGPPILALHGFPASSYDWRHLAGLLPGHRFIAFDLPGFGLSDKSPTGDYSLEGHATVAERLLAHLKVDACDVVAHDIGDSVAAELMHRINTRSLSFKLGRVALLNGSIFIDLAQLTSGQKLFLRLPPRPLRIVPPVRMFRRQIKSLFSPEHQPPDDEFEMMELFLQHDGGIRIVPMTIRYINERRRNQPRWTESLVEFQGELAALWGELDTVAVPAMVDRLSDLRPGTQVTRWPDVAHWPQVEVPDRVATGLQRFFG
jgi:pimeloyl-ACP methyl ester carboxylesterase